MTIGKRIREARKKEGLTQTELAEKIGVMHSAIYKYETGIVDIPASKIQKIAAALNVTPAYLMGWDGESSAEESEIQSELASFLEIQEIMAKAEEDAANTYIIHGSQGKGSVVKSGLKDKGGTLTSELISSAIDLGEVALENIKRINTAYEKLNETGKKVAVERVEELADIPKYTEKK